MGKLIILSGPSCVGKSPLDKALKKFHPELRGSLQHLVLSNSRQPRPGEKDGVDYHFRTQEYIQNLREDERYVVMEVRGDWQALDIKQLSTELKKTDVFYEGNPMIGKLLLTHENLSGIKKNSIFLSPLSASEIKRLKKQMTVPELNRLITDVMRRKLLRRTRGQKGELSLPDLENIEIRAKSAYMELRTACLFDHVIPNTNGEDSDNWDAFYFPIGDAGKTLEAVAAILQGKKTPLSENWSEDLLP